MSGMLLFHLKKHRCEYEELNVMSKKLVALALEKNFGIVFNCPESDNETFSSGALRDFFHISDSFLYRNYDFLNMPDLMLKLCGANDIDELDLKHYPSKEEIRDGFINEFEFLNQILDIVFEFEVDLIEMIVVDSLTGIFLPYEEYEEYHLSRNSFLYDLFHLLNDPLNNGFNYEFPTAKILISKFDPKSLSMAK